jgi:hypothetical protein
MPWSKDKTLPSLKNKSDEIKVLFAEVANKVLSKTQDEEKAIEAGLSSVSKKEGKVRVKKSINTPEGPLHLQMILRLKESKDQERLSQALESPLETLSEEDSTQGTVTVEKALETLVDDPILSLDWDKYNRLVLRFKSGKEIKSKPIPLKGNTSSVTIVGNGPGGSGSTEGFIKESFETVSKNLDSSNALYQYTDGNLSSITYANGVIKTFEYLQDSLVSVSLSGNTPQEITLVKTFTYIDDNLAFTNYSQD